MFKNNEVFSGSSVDDLHAAKQFYGDVLGFEIHEFGEMGFGLKFAGGGEHFFYPKEDHQPATFTVLNFKVDDIDAAVKQLKEKGVQFEQYHREDLPQDADGVMRGLSADMGPDIAWLKDPAGNVLSIVQEV